MSLPLVSDCFDSFAHTAAPIAVTSLWQGLVIFAGLALCLKSAPRITAAQRFVGWAITFAALVALPLIPRLFGSFESSATAAAPASPHPWLQLDARWTLAIAGLWAVATVIRAADLVFHSLRLHRLWRTATPIDFPASSKATRTFEVCSTQSLDRPSVIGFFAPRILIPDWLLPRLTAEELHQIVLHESEHLRRRDDWTNLLQKICLVLFPLNLALWAVERQLSKEREMACDEAVVRITQAPRAYAACLASLAERGLEHRGPRGQVNVRGVNDRKQALTLGAWQRRSELVQRVHRILRRNRLLHPVAARALLGAVACALFVVTVELARCPQLVAFVPTAQPAQAFATSNQADQLGDAVYPSNPRHPQLAQGFSAERAKAEMPSASYLKTFADTSAPRTKALAVRQPAGLTPTEQDANRQHPSEQGWIVFTAWEQVETVVPNEESPANTKSLAEKTGTTADYDTGATQSGSATPTAPSTTSRVRVTQLIFRVLPAGSNSSHTATVPFGDGWIVIQL